MSNPLLITNDSGHITGFNVFAKNPFDYFTLVDDSVATRFQPVNTIDLLLTEQELNAKRNLPTFWTQNPIDDDTLTNFQVKLPAIEKEEWLNLVLFFEHWAKDGLTNKTLEVGTFIMYDESEKRLFFIVPEQTVSAVSVEWKDLSTKQAINLDGSIKQTVSQWNTDYRFIGYCHSHNTMTLNTPSGTDDAQEVYGRPFGLHLLLSTFKWDADDDVSFEVTYTAGVNDHRVFLDASTIVPPLTIEEINEHREKSDFSELNKLVKVVNFTYRYANKGWKGWQGWSGGGASKTVNNYTPYVSKNQENGDRKWLGGCWCVLDGGEWVPENCLVDPYADWAEAMAWDEYYSEQDPPGDDQWPTNQLPQVITIEDGEVVEDPDLLLPGAISEEVIASLELDEPTEKHVHTVEAAELVQLERQLELVYLLGKPKKEVLDHLSQVWDILQEADILEEDTATNVTTTS